MRILPAQRIADAVAALCAPANIELPEDVACAIDRAHAAEDGPLARSILQKLQENRNIARDERLPLCQDTGMACLFVDVGQDVHIEGNLTEALNEGVRRGYAEGYLRKSVVADPLRRVNTGDNTPAIVHYDIVPGDRVHILLAPKGFGSENMSRIAMLSPSDGRAGVVAFVVDAVRRAGPNPCPPIVVGVGLGGTFERCAQLAKRALLRPLGSAHADPYYADLERDLFERIQSLGIGPQGFGGRTTALGVQIEAYPTHIAGLPCAVNISCHVHRHAEVTL